MSKTIVLSNGGWLDKMTPKKKKAALVKNIFSMASQHGWEVKMEGQKWNAESANS